MFKKKKKKFHNKNLTKLIGRARGKRLLGILGKAVGNSPRQTMDMCRRHVDVVWMGRSNRMPPSQWIMLSQVEPTKGRTWESHHTSQVDTRESNNGWYQDSNTTLGCTGLITFTCMHAFFFSTMVLIINFVGNIWKLRQLMSTF